MSSIPQRIADLQTDREMLGRRADFAKLVRYHMIGRTGPAAALQAAIEDRAPPRVVDAIRAAQDPMSLGSVGGQLSPFALLAQSFVNSLAAFGAYDRMEGSMLKLPLRSKIVSVTQSITGTSLAEMDVKRVGQLNLSASDLTISKVAAIIAITREVILAGGDGALQFLERELRQAVAVATDTAFLSLITAGATSIPSSGSSIAAVRLDMRACVQQIGLGAASRLFWITTPDIAAAWSTLGGDSGPAFPGARYNGGDAAGIPIVTTDGCPNQQIILADCSGIAANSEGLRLDTSEQTSLQMDSAVDSPPIASTNMLSMWQLQMLATKIERFFGAKVVRANSVVVITGANYTGNSP
jgi:hypothetical protein